MNKEYLKINYEDEDFSYIAYSSNNFVAILYFVVILFIIFEFATFFLFTENFISGKLFIFRTATFTVGIVISMILNIVLFIKWKEKKKQNLRCKQTLGQEILGRDIANCNCEINKMEVR